jgi:hypothetical protein
MGTCVVPHRLVGTVLSTRPPALYFTNATAPGVSVRIGHIAEVFGVDELQVLDDFAEVC